MIGLILHLWDSGQRPDVGDHELTYELAPLSCSIGKAGTGLKHLCPISDLFEVWAREFRVSVLSLSCMDVFCAVGRIDTMVARTNSPTNQCAVVFVYGSLLYCRSLLHFGFRLCHSVRRD